MNEGQLIAQPGNQQMTLLRESYLALCDGDACAARLLNTMERWLYYKLKTREEVRGRNRTRRKAGIAASNDEDLWVRMAIEPKDNDSLGWRRELMGEYSYKIVARALDLLVSKGFVLKRDNPRQNWDRTPQWLFQVDAVQAAVEAWSATRPDSGMTEDPDGVRGSESSESGHRTSDFNHSAQTTDSTRQICRVELVEVPSRFGGTAGSTRQKDRSNNTGVLQQESFSGVLQTSSDQQTDGLDRGHDDDDDSRIGNDQNMGAPLKSRRGPLSEINQGLSAGTKRDSASAVQNVPGAPAGGWAILNLQPVPRSELETRASRDPASISVLRSLMSASSPTRLTHLNEQLAHATTSGIPRHLFTRLTDEELHAALLAAQHDARSVRGGFANAGYYALDQLIGEPVTVNRLTGQAASPTPGPLGRAYEVTNEPGRPARTDDAEPAGPELDLESKFLGRWAVKRHPQQVVDVVRYEDRPGSTPLLYLADGKTLTPAEIVVRYCRPLEMPVQP